MLPKSFLGYLYLHIEIDKKIEAGYDFIENKILEHKGDMNGKNTFSER